MNIFSFLSLKRKIVVFIALLFSLPLSAQPIINSFSPVSGSVGTSVTITGTNFSTTPANNIVYFGAVRANVTAASATSLTVTVPSGSNYQPITVTVSGFTGYSSRPFLVTFTGGGQISSLSFGARQDFTTDVRPNAVALSDFDGDGKIDVATANNHSNAGLATVSILRNTSSASTISFAPKQDMVTGGVTYCIASTDIDGDGKHDIISGSIASSSISVFRNTSTTGNISFAPKIDFAVTGAPYDIAARDIDGDGKTDIAIVDNGITFQGMSVFRNTGTIGVISFAPKIDFATQLSPKSIVSSDLDGDGKTDIGFTNENSNSFSIYRNTSTSGTVSFASRIDYSCGSGNVPYSLSLADIDGDSKMDVGVVFTNTSAGGGIQLYRNTSSSGTITLNLATSLTGGSFSNVYYHSAFDDLNGDGKPDLALSIGSSGITRVYQNNSTVGVFSFGIVNNLANSFAPYTVSMGDLDGDGRTDLIETEFTMEKISVFKNNCGSPVITGFTPTTGGTNTVVTIFGFNFTGATAVKFGGVSAASYSVLSASSISATVGSGASGNVEVTNALGTGSIPGFVFPAPPVITSFTPVNAGIGMAVTITGNNFTNATAVSFGGTPATSFTINNATSITATVGTGTSGNVSVTNQFGTGVLPGFVFQPPPSITSFTPTTGGIGTTVTISGVNFTNVTSVFFGGVPATSYTVNSSTSISAVVSEGATGNMKIVTLWGEAISFGNFFFPPPSITSFTPHSGQVGSTVTINGANFRTTAVNNNVFFGSVKGVVTSATPNSLSVIVPSGTTYKPLSVVVNNHTANTLTPFNTTYPDGNNSFINTSFKWISGYNTQEDPRRVLLADIDNDGKSDIITGNFFSRSISVLRNTGAGGVFNFSSPVQVASGLGTQVLLAIGDLNSDGKLDIAVTGTNSLVSVLLNTSTNGIISFTSRVDFPAIDFCRGITIGDFDNDAKPDIAVTTVVPATSTYYVSVYKNIGFNGSIAFAPRLDISVSGIPEEIYAGDFDYDGKVDLALGLQTAVGVLRNTSASSISFGALQVFSSGNYSQITVADIDGDDKSEIVSINNPGNSMSVLRNTSTTGTVSFATPAIFSVTSGTSLIRIGQLDGDGKPDLTYLPTNDKMVFVRRNSSSPGIISFEPAVQYSPQLTFNWVSDLAIGDLEGDAKDDFVVASGPDNKVSVFKNRNGLPGIISFTPVSAPTGATVTINGVNLSGITSVKFGNVAASSFSVINSTTISAIVGTGATGSVHISTAAIADSLPGFTFLAPPSITSFSPASGIAGTTISITGSNFTAASSVLFGGIAASSFTVVSPITITAVVGTGASGSVSITTPGGTSSLAGFTFVFPPTITSFTPTLANTGATVTITGTNFTGATAVSFGGVGAASFSVVNATTITVVVGSGASGNVSVTTPGGTATRAGFIFVQTPAITSFTPASGATGATITITGSNFTGASGVSFGGVIASSFVVVNPNTISAIVSNGATGNISVTTPGGTATSLATFTYDVLREGIIIKPNPANDIVTVTHPVSIRQSFLKLIDLNGRTVKLRMVTQNSGSTSMSVKGIPTGLYKLIWTDEETIFERTLMITH
jgi:FG-GAP-like repeat/IPT/TIG domain/Secretion system C-terminal sorting domain